MFNTRQSGKFHLDQQKGGKMKQKNPMWVNILAVGMAIIATAVVIYDTFFAGHPAPMHEMRDRPPAKPTGVKTVST